MAEHVIFTGRSEKTGGLWLTMGHWGDGGSVFIPKPDGVFAAELGPRVVKSIEEENYSSNMGYALVCYEARTAVTRAAINAGLFAEAQQVAS